MFKSFWNKIHNGIGNRKGSVGIPVLLVGALAAIIVVSLIPTIGSLNTRTALRIVENQGYVVFAAGEYEDLNDRLDDIEVTQEDNFGASAIGLAVTETLMVSPNGNSTDGKTWATAYSTIQVALDAASIDADDCTLILLSPHTSFYDINTTGNPTWTGNYEIRGTHRAWALIRNNHIGATSVMNFSGKTSLENLAIFTTGSVDGVRFTESGWRIRNCGFNSQGITGAATSVHIDGSVALTRGGIMEDVQFLGAAAFTKAILIEQSSVNEFYNVRMNGCLTGIHITDADSDYNFFCDGGIGNCAVGIDIDAGNEQHFDNITFRDNGLSVDDVVGDHVWANIYGNFPIVVLPDDFTGVNVPTAVGIDTWGTLTTVYTDAGSGPFRIVGVNLLPAIAQWYRVRFHDGSTYFDDFLFEANKREGSAAPSGTEFIFNKGTVIQAQSKCEGGGPDALNIWLEIQGIN